MASSRCIACDAIMSQKDMRRKYKSTSEDVDLCSHCFDTIKDQVTTNDNDPTLELDELDYWTELEATE